MPKSPARHDDSADRARGVRNSFQHDIATLAAKMGELLESAPRATMGAAGRAFAIQHPLEEQTSEFLHLYDEIASARR